MKTVAENKDFKVESNSTGTFFVTDNNGDCWKCYKSQAAAIRYMNSIA